MVKNDNNAKTAARINVIFSYKVINACFYAHTLYCSLIYANESNGWESVHNLSSLVKITT